LTTDGHIDMTVTYHCSEQTSDVSSREAAAS
jgi:hypothetical protein